MGKGGGNENYVGRQQHPPTPLDICLAAFLRFWALGGKILNIDFSKVFLIPGLTFGKLQIIFSISRL